MSSNIDQHLYAKPNTNQAMISSFPEAAPPSQPDDYQSYPNPPTNNPHQYSPPPQGSQDPFAPSVPGHQNQAVPQQHSHNQPSYPQNSHYPQGNNFQQNHHGNFQPIQQPPVQYVQAPQQVVVQQVIQVVNQPQTSVTVSMMDYSNEDFRMLSGCYSCFRCWLKFYTTVTTIFCVLFLLLKGLWSSWGMTTGALFALVVYLTIFAKIQSDAIAEMRLSKAKTAMRGFLGYLVYYWIVMAFITSQYNSDVGTLGRDMSPLYILPIPVFLVGSIFVKGKLTRYEKHMKKATFAVNGGY